MPKLTVHPLTPEHWPDFVRLFGERGVGGGCWCMGWRLPDREQYLLHRAGLPGLEAVGRAQVKGTLPVRPRGVNSDSWSSPSVCAREFVAEKLPAASEYGCI